MIGWIKRLFGRKKERQSATDYHFVSMTGRQKLLAGYEILRGYGMWDVLTAELVGYSSTRPSLSPFEEVRDVKFERLSREYGIADPAREVEFERFLREYGISEPDREVEFERFLREHGIAEADIADLLKCGFLDSLAGIGETLNKVAFIANLIHANGGLLELDERRWVDLFLNEVNAAERNNARAASSSPIRG